MTLKPLQSQHYQFPLHLMVTSLTAYPSPLPPPLPPTPHSSILLMQELTPFMINYMMKELKFAFCIYHHYLFFQTFRMYILSLKNSKMYLSTARTLKLMQSNLTSNVTFIMFSSKNAVKVNLNILKWHPLWA